MADRPTLMTCALMAATALAGVTVHPGDAFSHNPVTTTVTFNKEIASLFERRCLACHTDGGMAMSLATWADARPWAVAIKEEVLARRMPPWSAERGYGLFANDTALTSREFDFLLSWIDGGVPRGEGADPSYLDLSGNWNLGQPDRVVTSETGATVEARRPAGVMEFRLDPRLDEDRWIRAIDYKPGDRRVARAAFFSIAGTGQYLGAWTPWHPATGFPDGLAFRLPAGARIRVEVLERGIDTTVVDRPSLALYFAPPPVAPVTNLVLEAEGAAAESASAGARRVHAELDVPAETRVLSLRPELSPGGRSLEVRARRPDGSVEVLLWIRDFRHDWQTPYVMRQPVLLPPGSRLRATGSFDAQTPRPRLAVTLVVHEAR